MRSEVRGLNKQKSKIGSREASFALPVDLLNMERKESNKHRESEVTLPGSLCANLK